MNQVHEYRTFSEALKECNSDEFAWIERVKDQLRENLRVGDALRFQWLREKRFKGRRVYYVINELTKKALLVAIGGKKDQQRTINFIIMNKEEYFNYLN